MIIYDKDKRVLFIPENDDAVILEWGDIYKKGFRDGYREGYDDAYADNYQSGYTDGYASGIVSCHVDASSITLVVPSVIVGEGQADVIVEPADADVELVFTSSDPSIATITNYGYIEVLEDGEVTFCVEDIRTGLKNCKTVSVKAVYIPPTIEPGILSVPASGGTYTIAVTSLYPWSASIVYDYGSGWISLSPTSGTGTGRWEDMTAIISPAGQSEYPERSARIVVTNTNGDERFCEISQEYEEPYFRIIPEGNILFEKSGGTQTLTIDTNMDIPWRLEISGDQGYSYSASTLSGTGYSEVVLNTTDVGCGASFYPAASFYENPDGVGQFQYNMRIYTGSTIYENKLVLQKAWFWGVPVISTSILNQPEYYPATGGTYTLTVKSNYGPTTYPTVANFDGMLGTAVYSGSTVHGVDWTHYYTYTVPANTGSTIIENRGGVTQRMSDSPCDESWEYENYYLENQDSGATPTTQVTVQQLIVEGYANTVAPGGEYKAGTYVQILPTCPYLPDQIINLADVALNQEQLTAGTQNTIVWNQTLPSGWTEQDIVNIYSGQSLNFTPRGEQFWDIKSGTTNFEITYTGNTYVTSDYPWGSYTSQGIFSPRFRAVSEGEYNSNGWRQTPATVVVNIASTFSSVSQVMFTQMKTTTALTINQQAGSFSCHDVVGMFEGDNALVNLNINGAFNYGTWRTMHNVFDGCTSLTGIPYSTSWSREHTNNTIYPHADGTRGSANAYHMFRGCTSLTYLGPTINMGAMSLSGCTYGGVNQAALTGTFFDCPELTDVRIINLNNNDWNFSVSSTFTYIPKMSAASIEYLLNNVEDVTSQGGHTVTFHSRHMGEVSQSAIDAAAAKGWNVAWSTPDAS